MAVLERAILVIEILADEPNGLPFGILCKRLGLPKGSVHPLVNTMIAAGYLERSPVDERLRITMRLPSLGFRYLQSTGLVDVCQPILQRYADEVGELVQLGVVTGEKIVFAAWAQGKKEGLQYTPARGRNVPLHGTATGMAWLASLDEHEAIRILGKTGFGTPDATFTPNTASTYPEILEKLRLTRERGYGLSLEESSLGLNACAVPFSAPSDPEGKVVGAIGMAGPNFRLTEEYIAEMMPLLNDAATEMSNAWPMREYLMANGEADLHGQRPVGGLS
ncbi:IclR family transcriptional regulator [Pseudooceanicola sp. MF1-13]|uniref:IclR family transcriptional regulator n=1 Tax=Pseudooceanicola sp. MF1-13 TaxID=3379095 RepID=UPI003892C770